MKLRPGFLFITAFLLIVCSLTLCFSPNDTDYVSAREMIVMRTIGHQILLSSGDSSSRVLTVNNTGNTQYEIRFESSLHFNPDSIIRIIRQAVKTNNLPSNYVVNVIECTGNQVVFGFSIVETEKTDLVPCKERKQPEACYSISITFQNSAVSSLNNHYVLGAGGSLSALMLILSGLRMRSRQRRIANCPEEMEQPKSEIITIGNFKFKTKEQYLEIGNQQIDLSDKESKILYILANRQNELVERAELQKVWEDDGVIVGRSLDMFLSKLRKKLGNDPRVRIVNIHGRGYKLEV
ncbi:winged helix-turn-helix domain-containing protein [Desertivirga brevis]|uniref:winged helix-turn-helix domain-containing protein n=1 Tax=Desertivirga brevis TaxID=2810310 RepID=UPI001A9594D1|nr:winged helix-turn-helix domain-containing protein [Pedobacter sp. SYSU D00873]